MTTSTNVADGALNNSPEITMDAPAEFLGEVSAEIATLWMSIEAIRHHA